MPPKTSKKTGYVRKGKVMRYRRAGLRPRLMTRLPTFTETLVRPVKISGNAGNVFTVTMDDIPQLAQYSNLYRQYKINWAKISILPDHNSYDGTQPITLAGMPRIAWAVNDTPYIAAPTSESDLLQDNGAKVRPLVNSWAGSFKPVPNIAVTDAPTGAIVPIKGPRSMFLNFAAAGAPNPEHYGISYWISQALGGGAVSPSYTVIVKINFSLRDPQ